MAIGNGELMHEYFPKHPCMGTARETVHKKIQNLGSIHAPSSMLENMAYKY